MLIMALSTQLTDSPGCMQDMLNRQRALAEALESEAKEDEFHLETLQVGCFEAT